MVRCGGGKPFSDLFKGLIKDLANVFGVSVSMIRMPRFAWPSMTLTPIAVASILLAAIVNSAYAAPSYSDLDTQQLETLIDEESSLVVIDVRMPEEIETRGGRIDSGRRDLVVNRGWLEFRIDELVPDKQTPIVVYCGINQRSPLAAATLIELGYTRVYNYADGFPAWRDAGLPIEQSDQAVGTMLYRLPQEVVPGVWSAIGATAPPTYANSGHNNNLSFIIGNDAVAVVNAGDNALLAEALHREIRQRTHLPVRYVILENGQGHAMLGTSYWQAQGAQVVAHVDAVHEIEERGEAILNRMRARNRDKAMGTEYALPDITFEDEFEADIGGRRVVAQYLGPAHSPGDIVVSLPDDDVVIAGDIAFHQRLLPVFEDTDTAAWIDTWPMFEALAPTVVVPGHGVPTDMATVHRWTIGYLEHVRAEIGKILDEGGSLIEAYQIDQSAYAHLDTFEELAGLNVDRIYRAMEFE